MRIQFFILSFLSIFIANGNSQITSVEIPESQKDLIQKYLTVYQESLDANNQSEAANCLNKAAYIYWNHGSTKEAVELFQKSLDINYNLGSSNAIKQISTNIGLIYSDASLYSEAVKYFSESLKINKQLGYKKAVCSDLINISMALSTAGQYTESNTNILRALELAKEENDINLLKSCYGILTENYELLGDKEKSFEYFELYSSFEKHLQREELDRAKKEITNTQAEIYEKEKLLKSASDTLKEIQAVSKEQEEKITSLEKQKELIEREKEIADKERALEKKQQTARIRFFAILFLFLIIIAGVLFFFVRQKSKVNKILECQNEEIIAQQAVIKKKNQNILESINYAKRIQKSILPPQESLRDLIPDSFILFKPRDVVSGDFYWFSDSNVKSVVARQTDSAKNTQEENVIISAIDCTGHGVPGSFMSIIGYNLLQEILSKGILSPEKILSVLNIGIRNQLKQNETDNRDGMEMAICVWNKATSTLDFAGAKNPMVYIQDNKLEYVKGDKFPIGSYFAKQPEKLSYTKHSIKIDKPTTVYLYSDGFQDQIGGPKGRKYMSNKFRDLLFKIHKEPMNKQKEILEETLSHWQGEDFNQNDDIVVIGFNIG